MSRQRDFEREAIRRRGLRGMSYKEEEEFRKTDLASRWLAAAEERLKERQKRNPDRSQPKRKKPKRIQQQSIIEPTQPADPNEKPPWEE